MLFYLGTHRPNWLAYTDAPLFVSRVTLERYRTLPRARGPWALDSGGFTELDRNGRWTLDAASYARTVARLADGVGRLAWAAPQDWMCEPRMLERTGLTIRGHQRRTVENLLRLREELGALVIPVLQGYRLDDYLRCVELYAAAGVQLDREPLVGLGTVCRRQDTAEASAIVQRLAGDGIRLHGFGVKTSGLNHPLWGYRDSLASCDSMAKERRTAGSQEGMPWLASQRAANDQAPTACTTRSTTASGSSYRLRPAHPKEATCAA